MKSLSLALGLLALTVAPTVARANVDPEPTPAPALPVFTPTPVELPKDRFVLPGNTVRLYGAPKLKTVVERFNALYSLTHSGVRFDTQRMKGSTSAIAGLTFDVTAFAALDRPYTPEDAESYERIALAPPIELEASGTPKDGVGPTPFPLYFYVRRQPGPISPFVKEYFKMVFSKQGQEIVAASGYIPLKPEEAAVELNKLNAVGLVVVHPTGPAPSGPAGTVPGGAPSGTGGFDPNNPRGPRPGGPRPNGPRRPRP
jgi:ABC-type phosphate transport system substrate-binding protein